MRIERKDGVIVIHPAEVDDSHVDGDDDGYDDCYENDYDGEMIMTIVMMK